MIKWNKEKNLIEKMILNTQLKQLDLEINLSENKHKILIKMKIQMKRNQKEKKEKEKKNSNMKMNQNYHNINNSRWVNHNQKDHLVHKILINSIGIQRFHS